MEEIEKLEEAARKYSGVDKIRLAFWEGAKWQLSQGQWIPVKEGLPSTGQKVLVIQNPKTTATMDPLFAIFNGKDFIPPQPTIFANYEVGQSRWVDITHWMELPQKPEQ